MTQSEIDARSDNPTENLYLVSDKWIGNDFLRLFVYQELPTLPGQSHNFGLHSSEHYEVQVVRARNDYFQMMSPPLSGSDPTNGTSEGVENFDIPYPDLTITEDEAVQLAKNTMDNMGIDSNEFYLAYSRIEKKFFTAEEYEAIYSNDDISTKDLRKKQPDKFYFMIFKPKYHGIPLLNASTNFSDEELYSLPFAFEEIKVMVSNDVVVEFRWTNPTDISNVINDNAKLISFDEIMRIAKSHMKLKFNIETLAFIPSDMPNYEEELANFLGASINISQIRLGLGGVPAYNSTGEYMLVPVWNFYGTTKYDTANDEYEQESSYSYTPIISINAVDGSIIEQQSWVNLN
jgi:hypothetical protein